MGYVKADMVKVHVSKNHRLCLKVPIKNKNNDWDSLYVQLDERVIDDINTMLECLEEEE